MKKYKFSLLAGSALAAAGFLLIIFAGIYMLLELHWTIGVAVTGGILIVIGSALCSYSEKGDDEENTEGDK